MKSKLKTTSKSAQVSYLAGWDVASNNFEQWSRDWDVVFIKPARGRKKKK